MYSHILALASSGFSALTLLDLGQTESVFINYFDNILVICIIIKVFSVYWYFCNINGGITHYI